MGSPWPRTPGPCESHGVDQAVAFLLFVLLPLALCAAVAWGIGWLATKLKVPQVPRSALLATVVAVASPCILVDAYGTMFLPAFVAASRIGSRAIPLLPALISIAFVWLLTFAIVLALGRRRYPTS